MRDITVRKSDLHQALETNMAEHHDTYVTAMQVYEVKVREWFEENLALIQRGQMHKVQLRCPYPVPEEHTDDYQRAIDMLQWDQGDTIVLSEADFITFINNEWGWHRSFLANTTSYLEAP
jgi:hypothetical protein